MYSNSMKRSEINSYLKEALEFLNEHKFALPPFAYWSPEDWKNKGEEYNEIRENLLGWDITDFGSGDFEKTGLFLFTIRNGNISKPNGKTYAEKILIVKPGQVTPYHYHKHKMEDIINRGGGVLKIQVYPSLDNSPRPVLDKIGSVPLSVDGRNFTAAPGTIVELKTGESITLNRGVFHQFWSDEKTLLGEVSMVNNDKTDNFFLEERGRFPKIEEDEEAIYLLVGDYLSF